MGKPEGGMLSKVCKVPPLVEKIQNRYSLQYVKLFSHFDWFSPVIKRNSIGLLGRIDDANI